MKTLSSILNAFKYIFLSKNGNKQPELTLLQQVPRIKSTAINGVVTEYFGGATIEQIRTGKTLVKC